MAPVSAREESIRTAVHRRLLGSEGAEQLVGAPIDDVRARVENLVAAEDPLLTQDRREVLVTDLMDTVRGLGALEPLLADPTIDEIMVNGAGRCYVERAGVVEPVALPIDDDGIVRLVERVLAPLGLRLDRSSPMVEARLADGSRLHAVIPPLAIDGPCLTIRRFAARRVGLAGFGVEPVAADAVRDLIGAGVNVLISGGTGSGKTTLLNA
ncbi:MAG: ATPase, T2SS/T4P/T4SS family, partial [Acidimicrobiia bacterium]